MTARARPLAAAAALLSGVACSDPTQSLPLPTFTVSPAAQWSGGTVTLGSPYFVGRNPLPPIVVAAETLAAVRATDSTVQVTLPRGASGPVTLSLAHEGRVDSVASVQRYGFRERRNLAPALASELLVADSADHPMVLGNTDGIQWTPVGRIDLVSGVGQTFTTVVGPSNVVYGLSPSTPDGAFSVRDSTDSVRLASLLTSPPAIVGTVPFVGTGFVRQVAQLSPGIWLFTTSHTSSVRAETDPCCLPRFSTPTESPWAVFLSPRGDRTTMAVNVAQGRVPVFDNATGDTAFTLPLQGTEGIAFSPDGTRLFAVGGYFDADTLVAVDATTGQILAGLVGLPDNFRSFSLAYSASGGGRLLVAAANPMVLALLVYDAATLTLQGVLATPDDCSSAPMTGTCFYGVVAVDDVRGAAHVVVPGSPTPAWTFDLLP
ncbi:MAG: hypothetical protein ACREMW_05845 [Gemmatimonadales bacterium]